MQMYEAALQGLKDLGQPTHLRALRPHIEDNGYFSFGAQDPERALGVCIDRHSIGVVISKPSSPKLFYRHAPATYGLVEWLSEDKKADLDLDYEISVAEEEAELDAALFLEQELHGWLFKNLQQNGLESLGYGSLSLFDPDQQETKLGKFHTPVGEIDMLLKSPSGALVIIELKRAGSDQTVGQICRYFGWVREELAASGQAVHGLVLAQSVDDKLRYAIKATTDSIRYRQLSLEVELGPESR